MKEGRRPVAGAILLFTVLAAVVVFGLLSAFPPPAQTIPYSDFRQKVREGQIAEVIVNAHEVRGTIKGTSQRFETTRIEDPHLLDELEQHGVKFAGENETNWWSTLAGWFLPLLVVILVWSVFLGRLTPGQGAMAFERSRAKIYAEDDVKVTFADVAGIDEATEELREIVEFLQNPRK